MSTGCESNHTSDGGGSIGEDQYLIAHGANLDLPCLLAVKLGMLQPGGNLAFQHIMITRTCAGGIVLVHKLEASGFTQASCDPAKLHRAPAFMNTSLASIRSRFVGIWSKVQKRVGVTI